MSLARLWRNSIMVAGSLPGENENDVPLPACRCFDYSA